VLRRIRPSNHCTLSILRVSCMRLWWTDAESTRFGGTGELRSTPSVAMLRCRMIDVCPE
jgi:hypothetical protein